MADSGEQNGNGHAPAAAGNAPVEPPPQQPAGADEAELVWKLRKYLVLMAILVAAITFQAGLAPPGGVWQESNKGRVASDIVMRSSYPRRYHVFFYCNTTAFGASLMVLILLLVRKVSRNPVWLRALQFAMILGLLGLMGAYAAGSCREVRTSVYIWVLLLGIFAYVTLHVVFFKHLAPEQLRKFLSGVKKRWKAAPSRFLQQKLRTYLLLLGILAATVTYQAGLNPPGGFWTDSSDGHTAGDPILEVISPKRYKAFFYCNATSFVASLVIIILLQSQQITLHAMKRNVLQTAMAVVLFGLMGAYVAGSSRKFSTSIYVFILVLLVFAYVALHTIYVPRILKKDLQKRRKFLMLLAILAASITYQTGISPPGGFWTDNNGHRAGNSVFRDEFRNRYRVFFYFNATAFMASLAVILLLVSKRLCNRGLKCYALRACVLVDLISLMGAFAAGSCRKVSTSAYVILVIVAVFVYVMIQVMVLVYAKDKVNKLMVRMFKGQMASYKILEHQDTSTDRKRSTREHKWRKDLMMIGTLAITVTYQAGLLPPGGVWPDDRDGHFAGDPILHDTNLTRYKVFFYCNATAFMASMVMVSLLLNNTISKYKRSLLVMKTAMVLGLLGLLGAYAAGSCRKFKTSAYIFALVIAVIIYIVIHVLLSFDEVARLVKEKWKKWVRCLERCFCCN
ncbi:unnamed protein product [Triticum turgidum subsp. durum]|uniref:PGG domain-containing protein n=1 Tax=Triticum turgidum subsp. durum TaxID=4567 RepID=A0A9R0ZWR4_TRITD|nr:unnamed protein product [Triticum turgidum subsp. durum]